MIPKLTSLWLLGWMSLTAVAQMAPWQNEMITQENREPSRTTIMSYNRRDDAITLDYTKSPYYVPLNGEWAFIQAAGPGEVNPRFYGSSFDVSNAPKGIVPGYFATSSADDLRGLKPPALPAENVIGQYRTQFEIPLLWLDRDIFLHVGGVKGGLKVYVNGIPVGYSEDSGTPAEFNIAPYITDGTNTLGLEICQWTTGCWLENATLTGAGIEEGVYLYSQPKIHIHDFVVDANLDSLNQMGTLSLDIEVVNNYNMADTVMLYYELTDAADKILRYNIREIVVPGMGGRDTVHFEALIRDIKTWSPETPDQYRLVMRMRYQGHFTEYIPYTIGFKKLEMNEEGYFLNGKPLEIRGVNYAYNGIAPDDQTMRAELTRLKQHHVNAIKCHYHPRKNRLYELCAEVGLLVCDEVNLNSSLTGTSQNIGGTLANDPDWLNAHRVRMENAWRFSRNHTGLMMWSMGSVSGVGYNTYKSYDLLKSLESRRPVAYAPALNYWSTDLYFPADPDEATVNRWSEGGDSRFGVISGFEFDPVLWEAVRKSPKWLGGFVNGTVGDDIKKAFGSR